MRVYVELPDGWGPARVILTAWEQAGYRVADVRSLATGEHRMTVRGPGAFDRSNRKNARTREAPDETPG